MILSFTMMGVAITGLAVTPGYATLGIAAPVLLVAYRLIQGFALGGEVGPSSAFLIEAAPPHRRGLYLSLQAATQYVAILAAGLMGVLLAAILPAQGLDGWGWRIAFLAGAAIVPFGIALRTSLPETLQQPEADFTAKGAAASRLPVKLVILSLLVLGSGTIGTYSLDYMAVYAQDTLNMPASLAFGATIVMGVVGVLACVLAGMLADRVSRKRIMLTAVGLQILLVVPAFLAMNATRSAATMYAAVAVLGTVQNFTDVPVLMMITQSLPKSIRAGALSIIYATAIAVFGGSTQFVVKALIDATGNPLAPAWFMTGALVVGAAAMLQMREVG
jgi:MFS family permease